MKKVCLGNIETNETNEGQTKEGEEGPWLQEHKVNFNRIL